MDKAASMGKVDPEPRNRPRWQRTAALGILLLMMAAALPAAQGTRRFGIFIGANNGGRDRVTLRYAVTDARQVSRIFTTMGGISGDDNLILVEPTTTDINRQLTNLGRQAAQARQSGQRTELVFYYSGHSDEEGLRLNREYYGYRELREAINAVQADMMIVILDSCSSGAITRAKGGVKIQPFLFDASVTAEGYAFLTSSAADEASQESDTIESSYFTHSLMAGLRGAADTVGDGRVTLNELYRYAYAETLAKTETSLYGTQHPSFDIQLAGSGDVVLTDIKETSASLLISEDLTGRISIRDNADFLVAELTKVSARPMELGLEPGAYRITLQQGNNFYQADLELTENQRTTLSMQDFRIIAASSGNRSRGDEPNPDINTPKNFFDSTLYTVFVNIASEDFRFPLIGFVNIAIGNFNTLELGFVNWNTRNFNGVQAGFINTAGGNVSGVQAGFVNTIAGNLNGVQSGFINTVAGKATGIQAAFINTAVKGGQGLQFGFVNTSLQTHKGVQLGFINYADRIENGIPIGFISILRHGGYYALEYSFAEYYPLTLGFKIGVEKFYTSIFAAFSPFQDTIERKFASGLGFGSIIPITPAFFFNPELNFLSQITGSNSTQLHTFIPYFGYNINRNFSVVAGPSITWAYNNDGEDILKPFFAFLNREINERNRIILGARAAVRYRFLGKADE
jgi:hypothetical protein